jgi:signal transduction histidine kinase
LVARLRANTELVATGRAAALRSAVLEERTRVARELHDSVGHRLTVLALHASAARRMWDGDRPRAEAAVATIARVAAEALAELQQGYAGTGTPDAGPDLAAVQDLVAGARAAGLPVVLQLTGPTAAAPAGTQLTAYRVMQEALTNVLRHAPGASVTVDVRCAGDRLLVDVVNGAPAADRPDVSAPSPGTGLAGMRRRVEACGGQLEWGRRPEGGFTVRAEFPLAVVPA